jgi:cobalt-zinc-cadmium efflux system outer membrane protein
MKMLTRLLTTVVCLCCTAHLHAQQVYTEQQITDLALKNSALIYADELQTRQQKQLQKTGYNLADPIVFMEQNRGTIQSFEVEQVISFPTVYVQQHRLQKQQTLLSGMQKDITVNEVRRMARNLYTQLQYQQAFYELLLIQDSLYQAISVSAQRQFDAGQIDYLAKTFAEAQYGEIYMQRLQAAQDLSALRKQLQIYTGLKEDFDLSNLQRKEPDLSAWPLLSRDSVQMTESPTVAYWVQQQELQRKSLSLERNKMLPGFVLGYVTQGGNPIPDQDSRLRAGLTIPLWFWQYAGQANAAKTGMRIAEARTLAEQQLVASEMQQARSNFEKYSQSLQYYESTGINYSRQLLETAARFFHSGQSDYISYLRNLNDAYAIRARYLETLKNYNQSIHTIYYLTGHL